MKNITSYTDYRDLLRDFYDEAKLRNPAFSYQVLSRLANISSRGFLYNVVKGNRRLSSAHVAGIAKAMKLSKTETDYFENLVAYTHARSMTEKNRFFERMNALNISACDATKPYIVRKEQYRYYSQWYHAAVRSVIGLAGFSDNYEQLARTLDPQITVAQAKRSVTLLESLGLIVKDMCGAYHLAEKTIISAPEVIHLAIHNYHAQMLDIAHKALNSQSRERRNFTGVTLGISDSAFRKICSELDQFRTRLLKIAETDNALQEPQSVCHLNLQLFSLSHPIQPEGKP